MRQRRILAGRWPRGIVTALVVFAVCPRPLRSAPGLTLASDPTGPVAVVEARVSDTFDDAEEEGADGTDPGHVHPRSTDLELAEDIEPEPWGRQVIGMRFGPLAIPAGATITSAHVTFTAVPPDAPNTNDGPTSLTVAGQASASPAAFSETRFDVSSRTRTSATVDWSPAPWTAGVTYVTPTLAPIVQEIVDLTNWTSGNSIVLIVTGSGSRSAASYDGSPADAPLLHVEFTAPVTPGDHMAYVPVAARYDGTAPRVDNGDFEGGVTGWEEFSSHNAPLITDDFSQVQLTPHSGTWAVWLGGLDDETSWVQQRIVVPDPVMPLVLWEWIASGETSCDYDKAEITVDGTGIEQIGLCAASSTHAWAQRTLDMSAYAGRTVTLRIAAVTDASVNSNYFVDDVAFVSAQ